jgi:tetratricopeptide (TPR) repeat protein
MRKCKMKKMVVLLSTCSILFAGIMASFCQQTVSEEAKRHFDRGTAAVEIAKDPGDYKIAIDEFKQAAALAPDWPDAFYNLGLVQEKSGQFKDAADTLKTYLKLAPNAADGDSVKSLINKLEFKAEQVLSIPDIINVLVSGFAFGGEGWNYSATVRTANRECRRLWKELAFSREDTDTVKVLKSTLYYPVRDSYQTLRVTGPVLKYLTTINVCDASANRQEHDCSSIMENEVEVVSRRFIKINQKVIRGGSGAGVGNGDRFACTFQK